MESEEIHAQIMQGGFRSRGWAQIPLTPADVPLTSKAVSR
jgi:hypothetical protein